MKNMKEKINLNFKLDRVVDAILMNPKWRSFWNKRYRNLKWYKWTALFMDLMEKYFKIDINEFKLYAIGQSHLDAAWKWTKLSTVRRTIITFERTLKYFKKYPHYSYSQTSPQYYDWVKNFRPELFEEIKEQVENGRLEPIGGMWVEADTNLPSGESLVRQRFYGQLFYLEHFGKISKVSSMLDTFGFSANLPQILVKTGAKYFWTTKLTWNDQNEFPFVNFKWEGIDGSVLLTHCYYLGLMAILRISKYKKLSKRINEPSTEFNSSFPPLFIKDKEINNPIKIMGVFYGLGDGGMGPLEEEIGFYSNLAKLGYLRFTTAENFFKILEISSKKSLPVWKDELYLETHRACFTSQSTIKRLNRLAEVNLRNCEILHVFLTLFLDNAYPRLQMEKMWKTLLFNQFHDILPGSSIQDVYFEQEHQMKKVIKKTEILIEKALDVVGFSLLHSKSDVNRGDHIVFNTLSWERNAYIKIQSAENIKEIRADKIPPLSFKIIDLRQLEKEALNNLSDLKCKEYQHEILVENTKIRFLLKKQTGEIISLMLKEKNKDFIRDSTGIGLYVFHNKHSKIKGAWDLDKNYIFNPIDLGGVKAIRIFDNSPENITIRLIYLFLNSRIEHYISLKSNSDVLHFETKMDIKDKYLLFKMKFPMDLNTNEIISEIPYGIISRPSKPTTKFEKAKWEFPAQKWLAMSDQQFGFILSNKGKYGYSYMKNALYMTLLLTPHYPISYFYSNIKTVPNDSRQDYIDQGTHVINYALKVHEGNWIKAKAWQFGYEFNYPLLIKEINSKKIQNEDSIKELIPLDLIRKFSNSLKKESSLISVSEPNIILQVIKPNEIIPLGKKNKEIYRNQLKNALILRLFETAGIPCTCSLHFNQDLLKIEEAIETDMLELQEITNFNIEIKKKQDFELKFDPFEIKTLKLKLE